MKRKILLTVMMLIIAGAAFSQTPTAAALLARVDNNEIYETIEYEGEMIIENNNRRYVKTMKAWARGNTDSYIEFTNTEDIGERFLKLRGRLYRFSPDFEGTMLITGDMLKKGFMDSDMSYEDTIENSTLSSRYNPVLKGSEIRNGRDTWVLELNEIRRRREQYPKRMLWIDKETGDLLHYELFAPSGAKLKEYRILRVEVIGNRRFPVEVEIRDLERRGSKTTFIMKNVILDRPIADSIFTMRNLER
jgi:outer membrane lipoprotein-sorting protein